MQQYKNSKTTLERAEKDKLQQQHENRQKKNRIYETKMWKKQLYGYFK